MAMIIVEDRKLPCATPTGSDGESNNTPPPNSNNAPCALLVGEGGVDPDSTSIGAVSAITDTVEEEGNDEQSSEEAASASNPTPSVGRSTPSVTPGAYRVFPDIRRAEPAGFDGYDVIDIEAAPGNNDDDDDDERIATELARLGIPFVEATPVICVDGVSDGAVGEEEADVHSTALNADSQHRTPSPTDSINIIEGGGEASRAQGGGDSSPDDDNVVHAKHLPTVSIFGHRISRTTAALGACLLAVLVSVAIAVPTAIHLEGKASTEDPAEVARKERLSKEIAVLSKNGNDMDDTIDNIGSPHGKALVWMLGEDNAHMDAVVPGEEGSSNDVIKQRFTLAVFYFSTGGDTSWTETGNFLSKDHVCEWSKLMVVCDEKDEVTDLLLGDNNLQGTLPRELPYLNQLECLNLTRNPGLSGSLPPEIGDLTSLKVLDLYDNSFEGTIPTSFGNLVDMTHLVLHNNKLEGDMEPAVFGHLKNIRHLDLGNNAFTTIEKDGPVGDSIFEDLILLEYLDLSDNRFWGPKFEMPTAIGNMVNLRVFNVASNKFGGPIPTQFGNLLKLEELRMNDNQFGNGKGIPSELGRLRELKVLDLSSNSNFGTSIPSTLGNLAKLEHLKLNGVALTGSIPKELGQLKNIVEFSLERNDLTGSLPSGIFHEKLEGLYLGSNKLTGTIPSEIGMAVGLKHWWMEENSFEGSLPSEIGNLLNLETLVLIENKLNSTLPETLGNLVQLEDLAIDDNEFTGELPTTLGNLENLMWFHAADNRFSGTLPTEFGKLAALEELGLSNCEFAGPIPTEMGNLANLAALYIDDNHMSGTLPGWFGTRLQKLQFLDLGGTNFEGTLPIEWSMFPEVAHIMLKRNNLLTGTIPIEWANLTTLNGLYLHSTNLTGSASFLCREDLGSNTCEDCGLKVDLKEVECECCTCCA